MRFFNPDNPWMENPLHCRLEGLTQAFSSFFQNPNDLKLLQTGVAGAGEVGNLMTQAKANSYRDFVMGLLNNPQRLAAMAAKITAPLDNSLVQATNNQVQGNMAARGLGQAPGIFAANEAQALAPFQQQNQNTALNTIMQALGVPAGTFGQQQNLAPLFSSLFQPTGKSQSQMLSEQNSPTPGLTPPPVSTAPISPGDPTDWGSFAP